jgi:hypothetical protein
MHITYRHNMDLDPNNLDGKKIIKEYQGANGIT